MASKRDSLLRSGLVPSFKFGNVGLSGQKVTGGFIGCHVFSSDLFNDLFVNDNVCSIIYKKNEREREANPKLGTN